ncbi:MAG: ceramide glucosyltransferase, partial [Myxococcales bacterium]|nr:ceramide glucosyltransferase [Myxococcales bacterium]
MAEAFLANHPGLAARLILTHPRAAQNPKVAQLLGLEREATGEILVISDSNVRVTPDYLLHLGEALEAPGVHLVSTLVRGTGAKTMGAAFENHLHGAFFAPSIAAGYLLSNRAITLGKSMAMVRTSLQALGGFAKVADTLAEDHALGKLFERAGLGVSITPHFVDNPNARCSLARSWERHSRWGKIRRHMAPTGFLFEPLLFPPLPALMAMTLSPGWNAAGLFALALATQTLCALMNLRTSGVALRAEHLLFEGIRPFFLLSCWALAWVSSTVRWRGHDLRIGPGTRI